MWRDCTVITCTTFVARGRMALLQAQMAQNLASAAGLTGSLPTAEAFSDLASETPIEPQKGKRFVPFLAAFLQQDLCEVCRNPLGTQTTFMSKSHWYICAFIMFLLIGCDNNRTSSVPLSLMEYQTMLPANVWVIPNHSSDGKIYLQDICSKKSYSINFTTENQLVVDTNDFSTLGYAFQFCVVGTDSVIFMPSGDYSYPQLLDFSGNKYKEFKPSSGIPTVSPDERIAYFNHNLYFPNANDKYGVYCQTEREQYYLNTRPVYQFDLQNHQQFYWGIFPKGYTSNASSFSNFFPVICPFDDGCLLSYQRDHTILLFRNQLLEKPIKRKSRYIKSFLPYPDNKVYDMTYYKNYLFSQPRYSDLIFDQYAEKFFRIAIHAKEITDNGKLDSDSDPTWSIIVMDKSLNIENEILFHYRDFDPSVVFPFKDGLLLKKAATIKEDKLTLVRIEI